MQTKPKIILACFFLSGFAGLIYEVVWARQIGLFLGITAYAHAAVISAYMAGLASGSLYFGRRADRHPQPLRVYAWLEIGVGIYAAITPWLFPFLQSAYVSLGDASSIGTTGGHVARFAIALVALLIPTFLMGGTLPLLVKGFTTKFRELGKSTSRLYGINTLGAMLGTLLAGFLLLPRIGVTATIFVGVVINLGIAGIVLYLFRELPRDPARDEQLIPEEQLSQGSRAVVLIAFATAGFAALLTQMAWIRALTLVIGGSVYAFTITLASFLAGIGLGSLLYARYLATPGFRWPGTIFRERAVQAALLATLTSLTLLLGLPVIAELPGWFMAAYSAGLKDSFALFQLFIFALALGVMLLPTLLMGALFPLVTVICTPSMGRTGRGVGSAYAMNTTGTILGALLGGVLILPWLGAQDSIRLAAGLYLLVAAAFWILSARSASTIYRFALAASVASVVVATAWLVPPWDKTLMVSGVFHQPGNIERVMQQQPGSDLRQILDDYELLYFEEGVDATVAVRRMLGGDNQRTLVINGKADASSVTDMPTQVLLAQLPLMLKPRAENALVIGLGSGMTPGSMAASEALRELVVLEISAEVVEASAFFAAENYRVLDNPKVSLVTADARNYLMASPARFDLVVSEPSNPWISGIANLFTDEFLKLAKSRLRPGGIMTQWFHTYSMSGADLKTMLKTFDDNFAYVSIWQMGVGDLALIGSDEPHKLSLPYAMSTATAELARAAIHSERDVAGLFLFGGEVLSRYVRGSRINSDEAPVIEFNAPRNLYKDTDLENLENIRAYLRDELQDIPMTGLVTLSEVGIRAPFMTLGIASQNAPLDDVRARWVVDQPGTQTKGATGPRSQRLLEWREGDADYRLRAVFLDEVVRRQSLEELLTFLKQRTGRQGGRITLTDGTPAIWLIGADQDGADLQLDMAWDCSAGDTVASRFALNVRLPTLDRGDRHSSRDSIANRISCTPAD